MGKLMLVDFGKRISERRNGRCKHKNISVCVEDRTVWCDDCNQALDPFEVILMFKVNRSKKDVK